MVIGHPCDQTIPELRQLWKIAFGDPDEFLDAFFSTAYAPDRSCCIWEDDRLAAAFYWLDCSLNGQKVAYLYALVTHPDFRGRGFFRKLLSHVSGLLKDNGYSSAVLLPASASLRAMYAGMGFRNVGGLNIFSCQAKLPSAEIRAITPEEFAALRPGFLPAGSVIQEGENLHLLATQVQFFAGADFLFAAWSQDDTLQVPEFLGNRDAAPGILSALGFEKGVFRTPGDQVPFAMFLPLQKEAEEPAYFGFAFD